MEKTDAKIRLFLELSHQHPIQILDYIPLQTDNLWNPEVMYQHPNSQYYYAFINDKELISRLFFLFHPENNYDINLIAEEIIKIKEDLQESGISIEFNGCNIEEFEELEKNRIKINNPILNESMEENLNENNNFNINLEEEKCVVFCRFFLKNFGFIHSFEKLSRDDISKIREKPIVYALKGRIKTLLNIRTKEFEIKRGDNDISNIGVNDDDKIPNDQNKKDNEDKNKLINRAIDGHWFLVNSYEDIDFLSLIKYKEKLIIQTEQDKINSNIIVPNNSNVTTVQNKIISQNLNNYMNPHLFSLLVKDSKKFVTVYQNKSCKNHHNKNEFICKDCNEFCCLECFEEKAKNNIHYKHKISLLDETAKKFEEDMDFMKERIQYLKGIIENEINDKKVEINAIKGKNEQTVNKINTESENIRALIKKEEINRAKVLGFLGNEALRILNDFNLKVRYIKLLNDKGDMSSYLTSYFIFQKLYKKEIQKNLKILDKKIQETEEKFKNYNNKLTVAIEDLKKII